MCECVCVNVYECSFVCVRACVFLRDSVYVCLFGFKCVFVSL